MKGFTIKFKNISFPFVVRLSPRFHLGEFNIQKVEEVIDS